MVNVYFIVNNLFWFLFVIIIEVVDLGKKFMDLVDMGDLGIFILGKYKIVEGRIFYFKLFFIYCIVLERKRYISVFDVGLFDLSGLEFCFIIDLRVFL